jgi:hypothetical protein
VAQAKILAKGVPVGGVAMTALYQFDRDDRLVQVLLERRDAEAVPKALAAVVKALEDRLGKSIGGLRSQPASRILVARRWRSAGTATNLTFLDYPARR